MKKTEIITSKTWDVNNNNRISGARWYWVEVKGKEIVAIGTENFREGSYTYWKKASKRNTNTKDQALGFVNQMWFAELTNAGYN